MNKDETKLGLRPNDPLTMLSGVGARRALLYARLGAHDVHSLVGLYPRDYLDLSAPVTVAEALLNEPNVIKAMVIRRSGEQRIRKGLSLFKAVAADGTGNISITIFNSKWQFDELVEGEEFFFIGKVTGTLLKKEMASPTFIRAEGATELRPVYSLTAGISNKMIITQIAEALELLGDRLTDPLPPDIVSQHHLCHTRFALQNIHMPVDRESLEVARRRLIFEELLLLQLGMLQLKQRSRAETGIQLKDIDLAPFLAALPFTLTNGQQGAIADAVGDMQGHTPMNRLVQGDVGSGKTMVAAALCYLCHINALQTAVMAPTQILAEQHYKTLHGLLSPLEIEVCLLTGGMKAAEKRAVLEGIADGRYSIVIGTHTLVQDGVAFKRLGLVVTDEQHRFGVGQRAKLAQKGDNPHLLVMSATPIPRTLALIIYGDLDISVIKELPAGRKPIETHYIHSGIRTRAFGFIQKQLDAGRQAYVVCPLIEENESELLSIERYMEAIKTTTLGKYRIQSLTGKQKGAEKEDAMRRFKAGEIDILVSTTVVEVGVDVANATIMLIENAERFGLSQLHQLRGRVGRGEHQSYCILLSDNRGEDAVRRLKTMVRTSDGFQIAEEDLKLRGPGDFFGQKQHGLPSLRIANLMNNMDVLRETQETARALLETDPRLEADRHKLLKQAVELLFSQEIALN